MTKINLYIFAIIMFMLTFFTGCEDPALWNDDNIQDGISTITVKMGFNEFSPALESRSEGNALDNINRLFVLVYNLDGSLHTLEEITDFKYYPSEERASGQLPTSYTPTGHVSFKLTLPNGKYHIYAVANRGVSASECGTESDLHNLTVSWDGLSAGNNAEMFGWFVNGDNATVRGDGFYPDKEVVINGSHTSLHAWLRRAASKITVAYDGSKLAEGVTIYLKSVSIKNLPRTCNLAAVNTPTETDQLIENGEKVVYTTSTSYTPDFPCLLSKDLPTFPRESDGDPHSDTHVNSLFFYENMQGEGPDKRQVDEDGDGIPDKPYGDYDGMPCGTYIEVEAYYISTNDERPGEGNIKYRFMLGKDIIKDYNAERNHHFKLTLILKKFANDPDWHIDYQEKHFEITTPKPMNFQGKYFIPQERTNDLLNQGYDFSNENIINITAYEEDKETGERTPLQPEIVGYTVNGVPTNEMPSWLHVEEVETEDSQAHDYVSSWKYTVDPTEPKTFTINDKLDKAEAKGTETAPVNLADSYPLEEQFSTTSKSIADAKNTANCYIVDRKGWYILPLVYGNGRENNADNISAYQSSLTGSNILKNFIDHRGKNIKSPFIIDNMKDDSGNISSDDTPASVLFIWQDRSGLLTNLSYDATAYGNKGGLKFQVPAGKQGNALIAIKDKKGRIMWSWQIWVTRFDFDKEITLTNRFGAKNKVLPVNLGWCSGDNDVIRYYEPRECSVVFKVGEIQREIKFEQKSHTAFTCGTTPHYQWGRKDPFIGREGAWSNKVIYDYYDRKEGWKDPWRFTPDVYYEEDGITEKRDEDNNLIINHDDDEKRIYTRKIENGVSSNNLHQFIQNPHKWHNPPHTAPGETIWGTTYPYKSIDNIYANLWGGGESDEATTVKTVYDPCPYGYAVGHYSIFSGFSGWGGDTSITSAMYDVDVSNMPADYPDQYKNGVMEFYTDDDKIQSIVFPKPGYRDWDDRADCYNFSVKGFIWSRQVKISAYSVTEPAKAYYLEFMCDNLAYDKGKTGFVGITSNFYPTNGYAIRPWKIE